MHTIDSNSELKKMTLSDKNVNSLFNRLLLNNRELYEDTLSLYTSVNVNIETSITEVTIDIENYVSNKILQDDAKSTRLINALNMFQCNGATYRLTNSSPIQMILKINSTQFNHILNVLINLTKFLELHKDLL